MDMRLTGNTCACGTKIVSHYSWRKLTAQQRAEAKAAGYGRANTLTECHACACRRSPRRNPQVRRKPRTLEWQPHSRAELLEEWYHLRDRHLSIRENCERIAPRLGIKPKSLETALGRAGITSVHQVAA